MKFPSLVRNYKTIIKREKEFQEWNNKPLANRELKYIKKETEAFWRDFEEEEKEIHSINNDVVANRMSGIASVQFALPNKEMYFLYLNTNNDEVNNLKNSAESTWDYIDNNIRKIELLISITIQRDKTLLRFFISDNFAYTKLVEKAKLNNVKLEVPKSEIAYRIKEFNDKQ